MGETTEPMIPAPRDGAESEGGNSPGPRGRELPDQNLRQSDEKPPRRRGRYLPRELSKKLREEAMRMRSDGMSYSHIIREIWGRFGIRLYKSYLNYWLRETADPDFKKYPSTVKVLRPSEELAYLIGAVAGDGFAYLSSHQAKIGLAAKDREFVEEFARCLAKVLNRPPPKPRLDRRGRYVVKVQSKMLYGILKKPLDLNGIRQFVEHCDRCRASFIRGFADSEGGVARGEICIVNTDLKLLYYFK